MCLWQGGGVHTCWRRQYNYGCVCWARWGPVYWKRMHPQLPFSFHCLHGFFFSTSILWRANPDPCYLNCSSRAGKAALSLLKTFSNWLTRLAEQSPFYSSFLCGAPWGWGQGLSRPEWQSWVLSKARPEPIHPESWSLWAFPLRVSERCPKGWNQVSKCVALLLMARRDQEKEHWGIKGKIKGATRMPIS